MVTTSILLNFLLVSGVWADCSMSALFIASPLKMEALSGSCLQIPCSFTLKEGYEFDSKRQSFGVWIKNDTRFEKFPSNVIFNSSKENNDYLMEIIGDLRKKNCTTLFSSLRTSYTEIYFFRVENRPFLATASCNPIRVVIQDSPPSPTIKISGENLKEGGSVTVTCSASTPCPRLPPQLTFNFQQDSVNKVEESTDGKFITSIQETITLSDKHDGFSIRCCVTYPVDEGKDNKTAQETRTLNVSYAPKNTSVSVSPSGRVPAGTRVNLTCSSRANPPISRFTWFKSVEAGPVNVSEGRLYSFEATDGGVYYCVATNALGTEKSGEINLNNEEPSSSPAIVGGIVGVVLLIGVIVAVWWLKSKHTTSQPTQSLTNEETVDQTPARAPEKQDIHYGEIRFSKQRPESASAQDRGQQQDVLYAQVNVSSTAKNATQAADIPESLYAQVKTK